MKCVKCGYLGFEEAERCRNCGYEFSLATAAVPDLRLRAAERDAHAVDDLDLIDAAAQTRPNVTAGREPSSTAAARSPVPSRGTNPEFSTEDLRELPLFTDDAPLITRASAPRPPLAVRRATPDVPSLRPQPARTPPLEFQDGELEMPLEAPVSPAVRAAGAAWADQGDAPTEAAGLVRRYLAAALDLALLAGVDLVVIYFTVKICGLTTSEVYLLPIGPLIVFLFVQNGGYLVACTAGGQTIGKMVTGIKVVSADPRGALDIGQSLQRTFMWSIMALPAGLGLLTALLSPERQGLHDRFAGTKVVRTATA